MSSTIKTDTIIHKKYQRAMNIFACLISFCIPIIEIIIDGSRMRPNLIMCSLGTCEVTEHFVKASCTVETTQQLIALILRYTIISLRMLIAILSIVCCFALYYMVRNTIRNNQQYQVTTKTHDISSAVLSHCELMGSSQQYGSSGFNNMSDSICATIQIVKNWWYGHKPYYLLVPILELVCLGFFGNYK
jgi:hypothetical protein